MPSLATVLTRRERGLLLTDVEPSNTTLDTLEALQASHDLCLLSSSWWDTAVTRRDWE